MEETKSNLKIVEKSADENPRKDPVNKQANKPTYEQLEAQLENMYAQGREMIAQMQEMQKVIMYRRLDYLFKIVAEKDIFGPAVNKAATEIVETLFAEESEEEKK